MEEPAGGGPAQILEFSPHLGLLDIVPLETAFTLEDIDSAEPVEPAVDTKAAEEAAAKAAEEAAAEAAKAEAERAKAAEEAAAAEKAAAAAAAAAEAAEAAEKAAAEKAAAEKAAAAKRAEERRDSAGAALRAANLRKLKNLGKSKRGRKPGDFKKAKVDSRNDYHKSMFTSLRRDRGISVADRINLFHQLHEGTSPATKAQAAASFFGEEDPAAEAKA